MKIYPGKEKTELYMRSMGKALKVTSIFTTVDSTNAYLETHRDEGVVAEADGLIFCANTYDHGVEIHDKTKERVVRP